MCIFAVSAAVHRASFAAASAEVRSSVRFTGITGSVNAVGTLGLATVRRDG